MPPAVALLNYISCSIYTLADFLPNWDFLRGFLYVSWISQDTPPHCDFFAVFFYLMFAGKISEARCEGREYQSVIPIVGIGPPPHPDVSVSPPLDPKGGAPLSCSWGGGGSQLGRLDRRPGTLYTVLSGLGSRVERKRPFTRAARYIIFIFGIRRKSSEAAMGGGRAAPRLAWQCPQKDGCA